MSVPEKEVQSRAHQDIAKRSISAWRVLLDNYSWELLALREVGNREICGAERLPQGHMLFGLHARGGFGRSYIGSNRDQ